MIKRFSRKHKETRRFYRTNERIAALTLRVLDSEGKQIGVLSKFETLQKAREQGLDVVEIAPHATPPVAKIIDFKKFLYQEEKKKREEKKKSKVSETKEIRLGPFMSDNDLNVMVRRGRDFLNDNNKVRLVLRFVGRQIVHPEFGQATMQKAIKALSDLSKIEKTPHFEGKQLISIIVPEKKKISPKQNEENKNEEKDQKISIKTV